MPATEGDEAVKELIRAGRKIEAIKLVREESGFDLRDAKDFVDGLEAEMMERGEIAERKKSGCGTAAVLFLIAAGVWAAL